MNPYGYVVTYSNLQVPFDSGDVSTTRIKNYLQNGMGTQSVQAQAAQTALFGKVAKELKVNALPDQFQIDGYDLLRTSLQRVFWGKGAPDEIQTALWLASRYGLVNPSTVTSYCDKNLGVDCGGFVANFWGIGRPTLGNKQPNGWSGFLPRSFWNMNRNLRRARAGDIDIGDAVVCFKGVKGDDPDAAKTASAAGSEAFHIAIVSDVAMLDYKGTINLTIAESSGARRSDGGNGVNEREIGKITTKTSRSLVYYDAGTNERWYFVGPAGAPVPYEPEYYALA